MSLNQRLKQGFLRLPSMKKVILISSFTLALSPLFPWYDQRNNFGVGDTFLGFQGPLFGLGIVIMLCGLTSFFNLFLPLLGRNFFALKRRTGSLAMGLGAQALVFLLVANSIFFHPDFAPTANSKATRLGMAIAFFSVGALLIAGWWTRRKEKAGTDLNEETVEEVAGAPMPEPVMQPEPSFTQAVAQEGTDPLTLDPKTRYRMMRAQARYSSSARNNLWGSGAASPYGRPRVEENQDY